MDGDLSLSQSLGGLRIANPDDESPAGHASRGLSSTAEFSTSSPSATGNSYLRGAQMSSLPIERHDASLSQLDFDPSSFSTESVKIEKAVIPTDPRPPVSPKQASSYSQRKNNRQSIPLTYQDQQQAQFPQYPTMVPQSLRQANPSARPMSVLQHQQSHKNPLPVRDSSYRLHRETSQSSISGMPRRTSSRGAATAMQAGVPSRESVHTDRSYRNSQQVPSGNGPLPPRRSSRALRDGPITNGVVPREPVGSGSPYGIEGGPLASSEEWQEKGAADVVRRDIDADGRLVARYTKKGVKDFHFGRTLGEGSYSTVLAATDRQTHQQYAIKVLDKRHIIKEMKVKYVNIEKDTLNRLTEHPGVVKLYYTFQDERSLYFVLDLASGGELLGVLKRMRTFDEQCTQFYGAQILDTIEYMHSRGIIHRDLKPENVLMDDQMHVKITDFGTAKILDMTRRPRADSNGVPIPDSGSLTDGADDNRANSFVGTAEYVSPELLTDKNACKASDLWAFGCIIFQLLAGRPPFKGTNEYQTFQKIVGLEYQFPAGFPPVAKDLVQRLLVPEPSRRLTIDHIKSHEFFDGIVWGPGLWSQKPPPLKSYTPPAAEPIKLNGHANASSNGDSFPPNIASSQNNHASRNPSASPNPGVSRPTPRVITELPPPSQLDIEWSPVLTRTNERILKLGNLLVLSSQPSNSPPGKHGGNNDGSKLSRFFGGGASKKRQRLVMVTSSGRIIMAAAGGDEKKTKSEVSLLEPGCTWRKMQDPKGLSYWSVDTVSSISSGKAASTDLLPIA